MEISSISDFGELEMMDQVQQDTSYSTEGNILHRIQALVCRITTQLARLSQETQSRSHTMKKEYRLESEKSADLTKREGNYAPIIGGLSLAASVVGLAAPLYISKQTTESLGLFFKELPGAVQNCGQMKIQYLRADSARATSISTLRNTEISNEATKSGEARDLQSELQQILGNIRELFKKASN